MQILSKSRTLQRVTVPLEDVHIIANPLLDESREKCCRKTEDESHEPEGIHDDVGSQWIESGERGWGSRRDGELRSDKGNLAGNLIEHSDVLLEIIHHLVGGADFQVLFAIDYECGENSRKKTSLCFYESV